jgi:hypothetical protein
MSLISYERRYDIHANFMQHFFLSFCFVYCFCLIDLVWLFFNWLEFVQLLNCFIGLNFYSYRGGQNILAGLLMYIITYLLFDGNKLMGVLLAKQIFKSI